MDVERRNRAVGFYNKSIEVTQGGDPQMGYKLLCSSVNIDESFPDGWYAIGNANGDMGLREAAIACYRKAIECDPGNVRYWTNLGHKLYHVGLHHEAKRATKRALEIDPNDPYATCNLSLIYSILGDDDKALWLAKKAHELKPDDPIIEIQLAFAFLFKRQWARGLKHFDSRFPYKVQHLLKLPYPMWRGEDISEKTLYLCAEMGLGDTLSFMRFLPATAAKAKLVRMQVHHELVRLVASMINFAGIENVAVEPLGLVPAADYWLSTTSMPVALGLTDREIAEMPQMRVPIAGFAPPPDWKARDAKLHIGVCWGGAPQNDIDRWRSFEIQRFLDLYKVPGIQLYSLQIGPRAIELHNFGCAALIRDLSSYIHDVVDTMVIMRDLDLIITAETSLGHIAGAIDVETWVLVATNGGDWRCGRKGQKSLWYPRHTLVRQGPDAQWSPVFDRVVSMLRERLNGR